MAVVHARKQIRDYVVVGLTGLPTTADRVYIGRTRSLPSNFQPTLLVYGRAETSDRAVRGAPPILERPMVLDIEGRVCTTDPPDDLLDQIALEIEGGISALIDYGQVKFFGGMVLNVELASTEIIAKVEGEKHIGGIRLEYKVTYRAVEGLPATLV